MQLNSKQIKQLMSLDEQYEQILFPIEFVKNFNNINDFKNWCSQGSKLDLQEAIKVFEAYEMYEYCAIMQDILKNK